MKDRIIFSKNNKFVHVNGVSIVWNTGRIFVIYETSIPNETRYVDISEMDSRKDFKFYTKDSHLISIDVKNNVLWTLLFMDGVTIDLDLRKLVNTHEMNNNKMHRKHKQYITYMPYPINHLYRFHKKRIYGKI
ncbi:hypothetical protein BPT24_054 [Tenacibaculum phage pT24]|uniref:Uncharacterized protein n=1 Tax=Tenacibaculum phage pT24 TaxID=1880590 RepID=A0A1B4XWL0_9CAUD|nr:hypothetical protein HYP10_gp054 [Tenacibaculum phage pT24]BAV39177.1 hypothetical protein BPT24_054 [Tenacibaculum phage pT24]